MVAGSEYKMVAALGIEFFGLIDRIEDKKPTWTEADEI
jgi:hypothetical protein